MPRLFLRERGFLNEPFNNGAHCEGLAWQPALLALIGRYSCLVTAISACIQTG